MLLPPPDGMRSLCLNGKAMGFDWACFIFMFTMVIMTVFSAIFVVSPACVPLFLYNALEDVMRKHCIGIVVTNRFDLTQKTLQSLYHTDQLKNSYDLYIIDNGSDPGVAADLTQWCNSNIIPVRNLIRTQRLGIAPAWNLFLALTADYPYRTKLDNDLVFAYTPITTEPFKRSRRSRGPSPGDAGSNPGAVPVAGFTMGGGHKVEKKQEVTNTRFLQQTEDAIHKLKMGICALPPVKVGSNLPEGMPLLARARWRERPVLFGGCMTIVKEVFDKLGYFDENLPCHIDWEYSQRAMAHGINVGYTPDYCVFHLGEADPTLSLDVRQMQQLQANQISKTLELKRDFVSTKWLSVIQKIRKAAENNTILNLK